MWTTIKYILHVVLTRSLIRNLNQLKLFLLHPKDYRHHKSLMVLKQEVAPIQLKYVPVDTLALGHPVAEDWYFKRRVKKLRDEYTRIAMSAATLDQLCASDGPIKVYGNTVIDGNGRVAALKAAGFKGYIEVLICTKKGA